MKKIWMLIVLLQVLCVSCASSVSNQSVDKVTITPSISLETEEKDTVQETIIEEEELLDDLKYKLISDWAYYLWFEEYLYGDILWAISYIEDFFENPTWENLQIARTAVCTAEAYINERTPQEQLLTMEEYSMLIEKGYDISNILLYIGGTAQDKSNVLLWCNNLKYGLFDDIFWQKTYKNFEVYVEYLKQYCENEIDDIGYKTNYIMITIKDEALSERLQNFIEEYYPYLEKHFPIFVEDIDEIEKLNIVVIEELEAIVEKHNELLGDKLLALDELEEFMQHPEEESLKPQLVEIEGVPFVLPFVYWEDIQGVTYQYYNENADGSLYFFNEQDELLQSSDGCVIECPNVKKEDVVAYQEDFMRIGIEPVQMKEEDGVLRIYYMFGEQSLIIQWKEEFVTMYMMQGELCFAPWWYIYN